MSLGKPGMAEPLRYARVLPYNSAKLLHDWLRQIHMSKSGALPQSPTPQKVVPKNTISQNSKVHKRSQTLATLRQAQGEVKRKGVRWGHLTPHLWYRASSPDTNLDIAVTWGRVTAQTGRSAGLLPYFLPTCASTTATAAMSTISLTSSERWST